MKYSWVIDVDNIVYSFVVSGLREINPKNVFFPVDIPLVESSV